MAEDITMTVEVASKALQTLDGMIAAVDKLTAAELRAAAAAEKVEKALNAAGGAGRGGSGRGGGGGGGGGGGSGRGGGGGGGSSAGSRTIDEEVEHRLKRQKREDRVKAELERRNPSKPPPTFRERVADKVAAEQDRLRLKDATDKRLGRGQHAPKAPPKSFDDEVKDRIAGETKRRAMKEQVDQHFAAPPKSFDDEVKQSVAAHRKRAALDAAVQAKINPGGRAAGMVGNAAQGLSGGLIGSLGKMGPYAAAAAAALVAFDVALKKSTAVVNIENDGTQTRAQKDRGIVEELVPFAQSIRKFREAVDGTTEALAKNKRDLERSVFRIGIATEYEKKSFNFRAEAEKAGTLLQAFAAPGGSAKAEDFDKFDRSSARGARAAAEQDITLPAYDERRRAGVEASAAREFANRMKGTSDKATVDTTALKKEADAKARKVYELRAAENKPGAERNKAGIDKAATEALKAQEEYLKAQQREEALILRAKEAGLTATQAESNARKANINAQKAELEVLKQREERMTSAAQKVGSMSRAEREIAKAMAVQVEQHLAGGGDIADLPPDMVDQAKAFLPERITKAQEASGAKELGSFAGQNRGIDDSVLADFEKTTIAEVRAKVDQVKADVRISIDLDVQQLAKSVVDTINPLFRSYIDSVFGEFKGLLQKFDLEREQKYNSEHP